MVIVEREYQSEKMQAEVMLEGQAKEVTERPTLSPLVISSTPYLVF